MYVWFVILLHCTFYPLEKKHAKLNTLLSPVHIILLVLSLAQGHEGIPEELQPEAKEFLICVEVKITHYMGKNYTFWGKENCERKKHTLKGSDR